MTFTVKGDITVKTQNGTSKTKVTSAHGLAIEGIHALVHDKGTVEARRLIEEHLAKYEPNYLGYGK